MNSHSDSLKIGKAYMVPLGKGNFHSDRRLSSNGGYSPNRDSDSNGYVVGSMPLSIECIFLSGSDNSRFILNSNFEFNFSFRFGCSFRFFIFCNYFNTYRLNGY